MSSRDKAFPFKANKASSNKGSLSKPKSTSISTFKQDATDSGNSTRNNSKRNINRTQTSTSISQTKSNTKKSPKFIKKSDELEEKNSNEMATTSTDIKSSSLIKADVVHVEQETDVDGGVNNQLIDDEKTSLLEDSNSNKQLGENSKINCTRVQNDDYRDLNNENANGDSRVILIENPDEELPAGWEQHSDKIGKYFWHVSTGTMQREFPTSDLSPKKDCMLFYHDDEEINLAPKNSSDEDDYYDTGAALTADDTSESTFVVYPLGCCEFDETQLVSATSTKAIQKCILRLSNKPTAEESICWGLDRSQPILMRLFDDHIQFTDIGTRNLLRSQPIRTIKTWAVDDDNNFAFVIEESSRAQQEHLAHLDKNYDDVGDYALLSEPSLMCYVFSSMDDDDMSCKVAAKLNVEINRHKEQMSERILKSTRVQQMIERPPNEDQTDIEDYDELESSNETTLNLKYIGQTTVPRPTGIDVLNVAIDKCLAEASRAQINRSITEDNEDISPLTDAKLHVSPSSVIVENILTGEIIVECRIRYLTFMGISKRDIRWCGFIMQNSTKKTFVAHCFECYPTAGHVCEAIQLSCTRMYEKVVKNSRKPETISITSPGSRIRNTLAKTFSRIKLNPVLN